MSISTPIKTFSSLANDTSATSDLNYNFGAINTALTNALALNGQSPNQMQSTLDMNSNRVINCVTPISVSEPVTLGYMNSVIAGGSNISGLVTGVPVSAAMQPVVNAGTIPAAKFLMGVPYISITDYGATTGSSDNTTAINNAATAAAATGQALFFPAGTWKHASTLTMPTSARWIGENENTTFLQMTSATLDQIAVSNPGCTLSDMSFNYSVTRTGGNTINLSSVNFTMYNFSIVAAFQGIFFSSGAVSIANIHHGEITVVGTTGIGIRLHGGTATSFSDIVITQTTGNPSAAVYIDNGGDYSFNNCQFLKCLIGMTILPTTGQNVSFVRCTHCWFDTNVNAGLQMSPTGTGVIATCDFVQCWFSSTSAGLGINLSGIVGTPTALSNINFVSCFLIANNTYGIAISSCTNVGVIGCTINTGSTSGVFLENSSQYCRIIGNYIAGFVNGVLSDSSAVINTAVQGNNVSFNTTALNWTSTGGANRICDNPGIAVSPGFVTPGASPWTYTAGPRRETHYLTAGTISNLTINGLFVATTTSSTMPTTVNLEPNETYSLTYTGAPTVARVIH